MDRRPKVLVVDDVELFLFSYEKRIGDKVRLFGATTIKEARQVFSENPDLAAIAMDACLFGTQPDTLDLVKEMRAGFTGPIIAISGDKDYQHLLLAAGCSHECSKIQFPQKILDVLGL